MQFNEPLFLLLFLPVLLLAYHGLPIMRNLLLLAASLCFAWWIAQQTLVVLLLALAGNYALGLVIEKRRGVLMAGVVANLALLIWCNYADFLQLPLPRIPRPPGLSFFTFVAIAYLVDVYRGEATPIRNPIHAGNYFLLFPKFLAGPIVRFRDIGAQLTDRRVDGELFAAGVRRFIIGLGKKVLIANTVAVVADKVFALPADALRTDLAWLGLFAYTLQIYFDFSGYTDMAIGLGAMFGFKLPENFNYPYAATSIRDFWRRWHLTLSGWLRDYLYIPLGGSRCAPGRVYLNLVIVFALCGLWHGARWTFLIWGLIQGAFLLIERLAGNRDLPRPVGHVYALAVTMLSWVFFRSETVPQALNYLQALAGLNTVTGVADAAGMFVDRFTLLMFVAGAIGAFPVWRQRREPWATIALIVIFAIALLWGAVKTHAPFIYQQF